MATLHVSSRALHCGIESTVSICTWPFKILSHVGVSACQLTSFRKGVSVNGVP